MPSLTESLYISRFGPSELNGVRHGYDVCMENHVSRVVRCYADFHSVGICFLTFSIGPKFTSNKTSEINLHVCSIKWMSSNLDG